MSIGISVFVSTVIYLLYLELNPKITGIWLRRDSSNILRITWNGLWGLMVYPFKNRLMWMPSLWDMNVYIAVPLISLVVYTCIHYFKLNLNFSL